MSVKSRQNLDLLVGKGQKVTKVRMVHGPSEEETMQCNSLVTICQKVHTLKYAALIVC